ncbi:MAG TPA: protein kinase [Myxococcales bacterium]
MADGTDKPEGGSAAGPAGPAPRPEPQPEPNPAPPPAAAPRPHVTAPTLRVRHSTQEETLSGREPLPPGAIAPSLTDLLAPEVTAEQDRRYEAIAVEGKGGQARVLDVLDRHLGRHIAFKEMMVVNDPAANKVAEQRFLLEARVGGRLEHPNIVPVHELGRRPDGRLYYTMRLVRGETLSTRLKACKNLEERLTLLGAFWDTCKAIAYAHARGVIHRDLKPANVMLGKYGETVLLDWGLAKVKGGPEAPVTDPVVRLPTDPELTGDGKAMGTPSYMSPEQATGDEIDERTDVWGLGAILYRILTGEALYPVGDYDAQIARATYAGIRPVLSTCPDAPPELAAIAHKALQRYKRHRYQTAKELADEISAYMTGGRVRAHTYSPRQLVRRFAREHWGVVIASAVAVVAVVGALVAAAVGLRIQTRERHKAELNLAAAYAERADRHLAEYRYASAYGFAALSLQHIPERVEGETARARSLTVRATSTALQARAHFGFKPLRTLHGGDALGPVGFSPDGALVAASAYDGVVRVWDVRTGEQRLKLPHGGLTIYAAVFSPDGKTLAAAGKSGQVALWRVADGERVALLEGHEGPVRGLAFSPDGTRLASASADRTARVWDLSTRQAVYVLRGHGSEVRGVVFGPDGQRLLTGGVDRTLRSWSLDLAPGEGQEAPTGFVLASFASSVRSLALSPDGTRLAVGCDESTVPLLDAGTGQPDLQLAGNESFVRQVAWSADGTLVASAGVDRTVRVWNTSSGEPVATLEENPSIVSGVGFSPDGSVLASASFDGTLRLWKVGPGLLGLATDGAPLVDLAFSPDGKRMATASRDGMLRVWDLAGRRELRSFRGGLTTDAKVRFGPGGKLLAGAGGPAEIFDVESGRHVLSLPLKGASAIRIAPGGKVVAVGEDGGAVSLWDAQTGAPLRSMAGHVGTVFDVAFSPDGATLASAGMDGSVRLWDVATGQERRKLAGHQGWVSSLDFARDGRLASSGKDGRAIVWDPKTGAELLRLKHNQWTSVRWVADGKHLATSCDDQYVRFWDAQTGALRLIVRTARELVSMDLAPDGAALAVNLGRGFSLYPVDLHDLEVDATAVLAEARERGFVESPPEGGIAAQPVVER